MTLHQAMDRLSRAELRSSEAYLRAALATGDLELRQFFIDMAREELKHAGTLLEISAKSQEGAFDLAVTTDQIEAIDKTVEETLAAVSRTKDVDRLFLALVHMERGELNSIYESLVQLYTNYLVPRDEALTFYQSTDRHLDMMRQAVARFRLGDKVRQEIEQLRIRSIEYYRNIT